jgi:hypothetical protein
MKILLLAAICCVSASVSAGATTSCNTDHDLVGQASIDAVRGQCRPGDIVTVRRGPSTCEGNRCTSIDLISEVCDARSPVVQGYYGFVSCTLRGVAVAKPKRR